MSEEQLTPSWIDAILDCPEADCKLVAYPYARLSPDEFACTCRAGHTTTSNTAGLRPGEAQP
jgi:hypothetical protein